MMKKIIILFILLSIGKIYSQTVTLSVAQSECNHDGILQVTTSGITPPYDLKLYRYAVAPYYLFDTLSNINTTLMQINNLSGGAEYIIEVTQGGTVTATSFTVMLPRVVNSLTPFQTTVSYSCPATTASPTLNISGGTAPYSILWENMMTGALTTSGNLPEGYYNYTITDANGCQYYTDQDLLMYIPIEIQYNSGITLQIDTTAAHCTNGTASVSSINGGTAPYTYLWNNGLSSSAIGNLTAGMHWVNVTDANGCYEKGYAYIVQVPSLNVGVTTTAASCLQNDGSATVFASGGQAPYMYQWQSGLTTQTISNLPLGYYQAYVTDANGCIGNAGAQVQFTTPVTVTYTSSVSQCTASTGSSTLTLSGGQAPYSVTWNVYPAQIGLVLSNMASGQYSFLSTDANGCTRNGNVFIGNVSNLAGSIATLSATCTQSNGAAFFSMSSSGTSPYTYNWSTGATTSSITNVPYGAYTCTLIDAANCKLIKSAMVYTNSPLQIGFNTTPASCMFTPDGSVNTTILNGTVPYSYQWSTGATTSNLTNQIQGHYYLTVSDAAGCVQTENIYLNSNNSNTNCYCIIKGVVYDDANTNCTLDSGEPGIPYTWISCSGIGYVYTDINGAYSFTVPAGTYTLTEHLNANYQINGCQSNVAIVASNPSSGCVIPTNFANTVVPVHDLHIIRTSINQPVPGNNYKQKLIVVNEGTFTENNIQLSYAHDGQIGLTNYGSPLTQPNSGIYPNWYTVTNGFITVPRFATAVDIFDYYVPTNVPAGTVVNFKDTVSAMAPVSTAWTSDYTPWNNVSDFNETVVSSFDPNFKEVTPKGTGPNGIISYNDTILEYVIHFQNTGTYNAQNIYVLDTLDSDLDWDSFKPGYADHNYTASMDLNGVVKFSFNNIHLAYNGPASNGMVSYRIKTKKNLAPGTLFRNKAAIFFDYNAPIITNTTINTLQLLAGIKETINKDSGIILYPNPTNSILHIKIAEGSPVTAPYSIKMCDVIGKEILNETCKEAYDISSLEKGIYFLSLYQNGTLLSTKKVMKE